MTVSTAGFAMANRLSVRTALLLVAPCFLALSSLSAAESDRPNFVLIMADDLGYGDVSCYGSPGYETPHIDRLAAEGLRFTDFHSNGAVCSPTRAALLTGRYQQRAGVEGVINADPKKNRHHGLQLEETTFAEVLAESGYATGIFGKWHVGYQPQYNPVHQGFDEFRGYVSGNIDFVAHLDRMGIHDWWQQDERIREDGYVTHLITEHAVEFIEHHADEPFCLYVAHECVHSPYQAPGDAPVRTEGVTGDTRDVPSEIVPRKYAAMMKAMDDGIGQIVAALNEHQLSDRTLVMFFSDNGANQRGDNGPLRGFKGSAWEGGHRVPCIARRPGVVKAGTETDATVLTMDLFPTLAELSGIPLPGELELDGVSIVPVLNGASLAPRRLHWDTGRQAAMRDGKWKLVLDPRANALLFDLEQDLGEIEDLSDRHPQRVSAMGEQHEQWREQVNRDATRQPD